MKTKFTKGVWYHVSFLDHYMSVTDNEEVLLHICGKFVKEDKNYYYFAIVECSSVNGDFDENNREIFSIAKGVKIKYKKLKIN